MAIALVGSVQVVTTIGGGGTNSATKPVGTTTGHVVLAWYCTTGTITLPSGFVQIDGGTDVNGIHYATSYRIAGGSEPATYDFLSSSGNSGVILWTVSGANTTTPVASNTATNASASATFTFPSVTPTIDNCWRVLMGLDDNNSSNSVSAVPSGSTQLGTTNVITGNLTHCAFFKDLGAGSQSATGTTTMTWGTSAQGVVAEFLIQAAGSGGGGSSGSSKRLSINFGPSLGVN